MCGCPPAVRKDPCRSSEPPNATVEWDAGEAEGEGERPPGPVPDGFSSGGSVGGIPVVRGERLLFFETVLFLRLPFASFCCCRSGGGGFSPPSPAIPRLPPRTPASWSESSLLPPPSPPFEYPERPPLPPPRPLRLPPPDERVGDDDAARRTALAWSVDDAPEEVAE